MLYFYSHSLFKSIYYLSSDKQYTIVVKTKEHRLIRHIRVKYALQLRMHIVKWVYLDTESYSHV